ncbi:MAG TPA: hypothetical protein DEP88_04185 [Verrucomicrobiales bacterium]|nr:hypothetical protein [Verrucomicrobiales bacterium]
MLPGYSTAYNNDGSLAEIEDAAKQDCRPDHRAFMSKRANFVVTQIADGDIHSRQILSDLCRLYNKEKIKLKQAHAARIRNAALRKNGEQPASKDVTIRFWKRDLSKERNERGAK